MGRQNRDSFLWGSTSLNMGKYYYFGIPKNGVLAHKKFFKDHGWKEEPVWNLHENKISTDVIIIAHIRNPIERYIRGVVESLLTSTGKAKDMSFLEKIKDDPTSLFYMLTSVNDNHTAPFSPMIPPSISPYQINWIPMDHPKWSSNFLLNQLFRELNLPYIIGEENIIHKAGPKVKQMQNFIRERMLNSDGTLKKEFCTFHSAILSEDQNIYNYVMAQYNARENYYTELFKGYETK